jgi:hypothetical protein
MANAMTAKPAWKACALPQIVWALLNVAWVNTVHPQNSPANPAVWMTAIALRAKNAT